MQETNNKRYGRTRDNARAYIHTTSGDSSFCRHGTPCPRQGAADIGVRLSYDMDPCPNLTPNLPNHAGGIEGRQ